MAANPHASKTASLAPLLAWPLLCLSLILTGLVFHIESQQLPWAWPVADGWQLEARWTALVAAATGSLAFILTVFAIIQSHHKRQFSTWLEWLSLHLLVFASIWLILPASTAPAWFWLLGTALLGGTIVFAMRSQAAPRGAPGGTPGDAPPHYFFSRRNAFSDSLIVLLPLLAGYWAGPDFAVQADGGTLLSYLALYPLYALFQLSVFLLIPATRMQKMGYSARAIAISCALVFSLLHWPNPLLMTVTGLVMLLWARQFLHGRSILALALVMGIAATGFKFLVPQQWSWELRIGPDYIEKRTGHAMDRSELP